jgi:hypothetical protein
MAIKSKRKVHALVGHFQALFLAEVLDDAITELGQMAAVEADPIKWWKQLRTDEDVDYARFQRAELIPAVQTWKIPEGIDKELIVKGPNICHSARLPAETRHLGILTNKIMEKGTTPFEVGQRQGEYMQIVKADGGSMALIQEGLQYHSSQQCPVPVQIDYKDYFFLHEVEGWKTLSLPNDAELEVYRPRKDPMKGIILVCFKSCDYNRCPPNLVAAAHYNQGTSAQMEVNGKPVTAMSDTDLCYFLSHESGYVWQPNDEGRFEIRARITAKNGYSEFSSVIVW